MSQGHLSAVLRFLGLAALVDLGIFAAVGLWCWWGNAPADTGGERLLWAGLTVIMIGLVRLVADWSYGRGLEQAAWSAAGPGLGGRAAPETAGSRRFFLLAALVGIVPIVAGALIQALL